VTPRFEPRLLPPVGKAPALWGAWDHKHNDWALDPGPGRAPQRFTSEAAVLTWAAIQGQVVDSLSPIR
jgi:hypothetical protein